MERIGRFVILEELGRGSMGAVYKARDPEIDRIVAVKIILTANLPPADLDQYRQRFQREAQAAGRMSHPGIVTIYDIAQDESGQPYLVMEFVEGTPLDKLLEPGRERLPLVRTLDLAIQVTRALDYAHRRGVIHRDIKPANILLTSDGTTKIADFGVAKLAGTQLTQAGQMVGTPAFMSPEQFSGAAVDARSDLFSLGAVLYWMATGERPFAGDTLTSISFKIVYAPHIPARQLESSLPAELDIVIGRALAKSPADRYQTCAELAADLEAIQAGRPVAATPPPAASLEATVVQPAAPVERTVALESGHPAEGTQLLRPAPRAEPAPASSKAPWRKIAVAAALAFAITAGGYWLWTSRKQAPAAVPGAPPQPVAVRPALKPPPVAMSRLHVICEHNFRSAKLQIRSGKTVVLETTLHGQQKNLGVKRVYRGQASFWRAIAAGERSLRVRVSAAEENYEDEDEISGRFPEGGSRTLHIQFGRGSALGVVARKLTLSW